MGSSRASQKLWQGDKRPRLLTLLCVVEGRGTFKLEESHDVCARCHQLAELPGDTLSEKPKISSRLVPVPMDVQPG